MSRLFACIWLPKEITNKIEELQKELLRTGIGAKFIEKENLHVTITFLGEVQDNKVNEIKRKMNEYLRNVDEFHVKVTGLKIIPNENHIRIIGVNVKSDELPKLIRFVGKIIGGSFHEEQKITLCRVKNITNKMLLKNFIEENRNVNIGEFHVKNISLVKSTLTKLGSKYETIHKTRLKEK